MKALYPYTANNEDELSISENDVLYLLRSDETDLMLQQVRCKTYRSQRVRAAPSVRPLGHQSAMLFWICVVTHHSARAVNSATEVWILFH